MERARFWDSLLKEKMLCKDDDIPAAYLSEFDQGLYGALIGGEIQFLNDTGTGWISSRQSAWECRYHWGLDVGSRIFLQLGFCQPLF